MLATSPSSTGSPGQVKTIGMVVVAALAAIVRWLARQRHDHRDLPAHQIGRKFTHAIGLTVGPAILDRDIAAVGKARFTQSFEETSKTIGVLLRRARVQESDHRPLLRARTKRPDRRSTKSGNELAPPHSITSSARSRKSRLIVIPRARAVARLTTSSNFTGCSIGKSAGLAPVNTFCT